MEVSESTDNTTTTNTHSHGKAQHTPHRPFGVTSRDQKRERRTLAKKAQRADRKVTANRQKSLALSIERLFDHIQDERSKPTADSRAGVQKEMRVIGKCCKKLMIFSTTDNGQQETNNIRITPKSKEALKLVSGHRAAVNYRKGRTDAELLFHHFVAIRNAMTRYDFFSTQARRNLSHHVIAKKLTIRTCQQSLFH